MIRVERSILTKLEMHAYERHSCLSSEGEQKIFMYMNYF